MSPLASALPLAGADLDDRLPQAPLFLEITKMLCDLASYTKWKAISLRGKTPLQYLLARDLYPRLRALILSIVRSPFSGVKLG